MSLGENKVKLSRAFIAHFYAFLTVARFRRKLSENTLDFLLLAAFKHLYFIIRLDYRGRLDKHGGSAAGSVMHHTCHIAAVFRFYGHNKSAVAACYNTLAQKF